MRSYFKNPPSKSSSLIVISVEGLREKKYFNRLKTLKRLKVDIEVLYDKTGKSAPPHVLARAKEIHAKYSNKKSADELIQDQFWLVLDIDSWTEEQLNLITEQCTKNDGWYHAFSNPCFEVWVLLHFDEINCAIVHSKASLNQAIPQVVQGGYKASAIQLENVKLAIQRARVIDVDNGTPLPNHPATRVYLLAQELIGMIEAE